tara:strand:+ start:336 stop:1739 length:1404 start_codon:yes stop_codon:yes gene_type:complete
MNILTDILSLIRRGVYTKTAGLDDVLVLGVNEEPDMTGVASPIPYKSVKVIKVRDFKVAAEHCDHANSPAIPPAGTGQVYQKTVVDVTTQKCTVYYRSLKSMSGSNLTLATSADDDYIEITTDGEPNLAANVGSLVPPGVGVFANKVGETLNFKKLRAITNNIVIAENVDNETIDFSVVDGGSVTERGLCAGKAYMKFNSGTAGGDAMVGTNFKIMGSSTLGGTVVYSPFNLDWTDSARVVNNDVSASQVTYITNVAANPASTDWTLASNSITTSSGGGTGLILKVQSTINNINPGSVNSSENDGFGTIPVDPGNGYSVDDTITIDPGNGGASVTGVITGVNNYQMTSDAAQEAIQLPVTLKTGDKIIIDWIVANSRDTGVQNFNVVLGWFDVGTLGDTNITYLRDVNKSGAFVNSVNGRSLGFGRTTVTVTEETAQPFAVFGFNFPDSVNGDEYNISWTLSTQINS